jgi:hypothetical protein
MTFNIHGGQHGVVNNVAGNQTNVGGQYGLSVTDADAVAAVAALRGQLDHMWLPPAAASAVRADAIGVEAELHGGRPDRRAVAERLSRIAQVLSSAGALASAGTGLLGPLGTLAAWLGHLGEPVSRLLGR